MNAHSRRSLPDLSATRVLILAAVLSLVACDDPFSPDTSARVPLASAPSGIAFSHSPAGSPHQSQTRSTRDAVNFSGSWNNVSAAIGSDDDYATANLSGGQAFTLSARDFRFDIPLNARVDGIAVLVEARATGPVVDESARITFVQNGLAVAGPDRASAGSWPSTDTWLRYGGPVDRWDQSLAPEDINNSLFGLQIAPRGGSDDIAIETVAFIDDIRITVFYTMPIVQTRASTIRSSTGTADGSLSWQKHWTNASSNLYSADFQQGTPFGNSARVTHALRLRGFGFEIPTDAQIAGVTAEVHQGQQGPDIFPIGVAVHEHVVQLRSSQFGANRSSGDRWPDAPDVLHCLFNFNDLCVENALNGAPPTVYGGPTDRWGLTLTPSSANEGVLELWISARGSNSGDAGRRALVSNVRLTIHYWPAPPQNAAPHADAGPDYVVAMRHGVATTRLDGTGSDHPLKKPVTYRWLIDGQPPLVGDSPTATFTSLGQHQVRLIVDDGEFQAEDAMVVTVTDRTSPQGRSPSAATNGPTFFGAHSWEDPHGVFTSGGAAANRLFAEFFVTTLTRELLTTGYGFLIPRDATINGIRLDVRKAADRFGLFNTLVGTALVSDHHIRLIKGGATGGADLKKGSWPSPSYAYVSYGGPTQLWGRTWTPADVNRPDFGASIQAAVGAHTSNRRAFIDHVRITVFYTESEPTVENRAPIADAGSEQTLTLNGTPVASVNLDGTGSSDPDGDGLTYTWTGPFLDGDTRLGAQATVAFAGAGQYGVSLEVSDGNLTDIHSMVITVVDPSPPTVTPVLSKQPDGSAGWYRTNVTLTWQVSDPESQAGIELTGCADVSITADQPTTSYTCTAESAGGVTGPITATIGRDATPPVITPAVSPAANAAGWHNANVLVRWSCTDPTSGVASVADASAVTAEGANQASTGICVDRAGNQASANATVNIDKTAPKLLGSRTPVANANGWNNSDVTVQWSCTDALSGVASVTDDKVISGDGFGQSANGVCTDRAENADNATVANINIDKTAPDLVGSRSPAANIHGWNNSDVTVFWTCTDPSPNGAGSGLATVTGEQIVSAEGANQSREGTCSDRAGNSSTGLVSNISIDRTAPGVTGTASRAPDRNGWYRMPLGIAWSGNDALSGVASCSPAANYSGPDGANVGVGGTCRDRADNEGTGAFGFKYDATSPVIAFTGNQGSYTVDLTVRIACNATDATSGIDAAGTSCPEVDTPAYTFALGSHALEATATDMAGNVRTESSTFTVEVTYQSLGNLVDRFVSNGGVANSLDQKLVAARNAPTPGARAGQLRAFVNQVNALRGRQVSSQDADVLIKLAGGL